MFDTTLFLFVVAVGVVFSAGLLLIGFRWGDTALERKCRCAFKKGYYTHWFWGRWRTRQLNKTNQAKVDKWVASGKAELLPDCKTDV